MNENQLVEEIRLLVTENANLRLQMALLRATQAAQPAPATSVADDTTLEGDPQ